MLAAQQTDKPVVKAISANLGRGLTLLLGLILIGVGVICFLSGTASLTKPLSIMIVSLAVIWVLLWNYRLRSNGGQGPGRLPNKNEAAGAERLDMDAILSSMSNLVLEVSASGRIIRVIKTGYTFKFYQPEQIVGSQVHEFVSGKSHETVNGLIQRVLRADKPEEFQVSTVLDRERWLQVRLTPLRSDSVLIVISDITEIKDSQRNYRDLIGLANCIIIRLDNEKRITFFNRYSEDFFGFRRQEVLGRPAAEIIMTDLPPHWTAGESRQKSCPSDGCRLMLENRTKDGRKVFINYSRRTIFENGKVCGELWVGNDFTE